MDHAAARSEEHTSELQSRLHLVCRLLLEKKKTRELSHPKSQHPLCSTLNALDDGDDRSSHVRNGTAQMQTPPLKNAKLVAILDVRNERMHDTFNQQNKCKGTRAHVH